MAWRIKIGNRVEKTLSKLDKVTAKRITTKIREIGKLEDPRTDGKALTGGLAGLWRYRVGDYRILCHIYDNELVVLVVEVAHRREVYRRK